MHCNYQAAPWDFNIEAGKLFAFLALKVQYYHHRCVCVFSYDLFDAKYHLRFTNFKTRFA